MIASWPGGTGDHGAAGKIIPALLHVCAPKTAEKDAEFATGETWPEILQLSTPDHASAWDKGNEQKAVEMRHTLSHKTRESQSLWV